MVSSITFGCCMISNSYGLVTCLQSNLSKTRIRLLQLFPLDRTVSYSIYPVWINKEHSLIVLVLDNTYKKDVKETHKRYQAFNFVRQSRVSYSKKSLVTLLSSSVFNVFILYVGCTAHTSYFPILWITIYQWVCV